MRAVIQRVRSAAVTVEGERVSAIGAGILVLAGLSRGDSEQDMEYIAEKCLNLRVFDDENGVMNLSLRDVGGEALLVSQFTLYGDARKGRRPSYFDAAPPDDARKMFERFTYIFREKYPRVQKGIFQAAMDVALVNDGPVTILLDSEKGF